MVQNSKHTKWYSLKSLLSPPFPATHFPSPKTTDVKFLLYPSRDFYIVITIIYLVFRNWELTLPPVLVFAFSFNTVLEGGFLSVHIELSQPFEKLRLVFCMDVSAFIYPVPCVRHLGCFLSWLGQRGIFFCTQAGLTVGQINLAFKAHVIQGESGKRLPVEWHRDTCPGYVLGSSL